MKVVLLPCDGNARIADVSGKLEDMQAFVGGYIEAVYPFKDKAALVCNDSGKIDGLPFNRALRDDNGRVIDYICGNAFIVGLGEEDFDDLTDEQAAKYEKMFKHAEVMFRAGNGSVFVIPRKNSGAL